MLIKCAVPSITQTCIIVTVKLMYKQCSPVKSVPESSGPGGVNVPESDEYDYHNRGGTSDGPIIKSSAAFGLYADDTQQDAIMFCVMKTSHKPLK